MRKMSRHGSKNTRESKKGESGQILYVLKTKTLNILCQHIQITHYKNTGASKAY